MLQKRRTTVLPCVFLVILIFIDPHLFAQNIISDEQREHFQFPGTGYTKVLPPGYEQQAQEALSHFPELSNTRVIFRVRPAYYTLSTRPTFRSFFKSKGHRTYIITISSHTIRKISPILLQNLDTLAQIGVMGHELSHVKNFSEKTCWQCFKIALHHFSMRYMDQMEFNTDRVCIEHGLGKELEAWSSFIRQTYHVKYWRGSGYIGASNNRYERYMNPDTIEKYMSSNSLR